YSLVVHLFCFFFQAEDGIRDFHVTGVQTCALPISSATSLNSNCFKYRRPPWINFVERLDVPAAKSCMSTSAAFNPRLAASSKTRSEERRVGKECRVGGTRER